MDAREKWSWFSLIHKLSGGDITKAEEVVKINYMTCLIWLSYEKEMLNK